MPERWARSERDNYKSHPFGGLVFGHGARMCIGRRFAMLELYIALIKIVKNFKLEYTGEPIEVQTTFVSQPDKPLKLKFKPREA